MDMLVPLLKLPPIPDLRASGVIIRRPAAYEITPVLTFIREHFTQSWTDEVSVCFPRLPVSAFIATREGRVIGFAAYDATRPNYFGPTGVAPAERGKGIGQALLIAALSAMRDAGYAYAIIGGVGPAEFYTKAVGAIPIPDSTPGVYTDMLKKT
jgi:GNAT superfamily N-acetyltransferase